MSIYRAKKAINKIPVYLFFKNATWVRSLYVSQIMVGTCPAAIAYIFEIADHSLLREPYLPSNETLVLFIRGMNKYTLHEKGASGIKLKNLELAMGKRQN